MSKEILILWRWQLVVWSGPACHGQVSATRRTWERELTSSFDRKFLVIILILYFCNFLYQHRARCHLGASSQSEVEVIETVLAQTPSRHVGRLMATCWLWLGDFHPSIHPSKRNLASKYAFESSRRDLHNALLFTILKSHFLPKLCKILQI